MTHQPVRSPVCPMCGTAWLPAALTCPGCGETRPERNGAGVWREGGLLRLDRGAHLPARCVVTNEPVDVWVSQRLIQLPPAALGLLLFGSPTLVFWRWWAGLGVAVLAGLLLIAYTRVTHLEVGLSQAAWFDRFAVTVITRFLCGASVVCLVAAWIWSGTDWGAGLGITGGLALPFMLLSAFTGSTAVEAKRITPDAIWLAGIHPDLLASLPEFGEE